jgi:ABC-type sugar transport system substrate-binding protein
MQAVSKVETLGGNVNTRARIETGLKIKGLRTIATFTAVAALAGAAVIPAGAASSSGKTAKITIGIAAITEQSPVVLQMIATDVQCAKLLGFKVVTLNANGDPAQMAQIMSALVNQNVSAIIDIAINPALAASAFSAAKQKHIPIIAEAAPLIDPQHLAAATFAPSDAKMGQLLAAQIKLDYPSGGKALSLNASALLAIVIRYQTLAHELAGAVNVAATHEVDLANAVSDTQTAVADALHANPAINMVWGLQDFEFTTALQTIATQHLGNVGVFSFYLDPQDFDALRAAKAAGNTQPMAVADSPVWDSGWYAFDAIVNKLVLHKKNWITNIKIHPFPYTLITPDNVQATGNVYNYPSYQPFFVKLWKKEGVKVKG